MKANKPKTNQTRTIFLTFLAFSREKSLRRESEENINPMSVIRTKGINHNETSPKMTGSGLKATAAK